MAFVIALFAAKLNVVFRLADQICLLSVLFVWHFFSVYFNFILVGDWLFILISHSGIETVNQFETDNVFTTLLWFFPFKLPHLDRNLRGNSMWFALNECVLDIKLFAHKKNRFPCEAILISNMHVSDSIESTRIHQFSFKSWSCLIEIELNKINRQLIDTL